jgi:cytochrome P450
LFFAIERESAECRRLLELYPIINIANPCKASSRQIRKAVSDITAIVEQQFAGWRGTPPPGLLGAILKDNPDDARDPVVIGNLVYMLTTTASDMSALLCWILKNACDHPEWLEWMANEPEPKKGSSKPALSERFVMETLRMRQSEFIYRAVVCDFDCGGFRIPASWLLRICVWESHRDPKVFSEPDRFNPDRFLGRSYSRSEYSPFGASSHACLASYLVTLLARLFVSELASHFRLKESSESSIELASSRHWAPGPAFRVQLQPR